MSALSKLHHDMNLDCEDQENAAIRIGITSRQITGLMQHSVQGAVEMMLVEDDINDLKQQLAEKDFELADLRKKVKDLEENNNSLCIKLDAKDEEVKNLKERIRTLEDEKKSLQQELDSVQIKLKTVEDDVKKLSKSREDDQEKYTKLEEEFKKIQYTLKGVVEDLETTKNENKKLNQDLRQVRHQSRYVSGAPLLMPVQASQDKTAMVHLGEMCCQIQDKMYKKILPEHFTPIRSYKMESILRDIEKLSQSEDEKTQALQRWKDLKTDLKWDEQHLEEALAALQEKYSRSLDTNPPKLSKNRLSDHAKFLESQGILKGWLSIERVNSLIDVWKRLVCGENP